MYLTYASSSERIEIDLSEPFLPVSSVFFLEYFDDLLDWHDVSLASRFLHCIYNDLGNHVCVACAQNLTELQHCTTHLPEVLLQIVCVV